MATFRKVKLGDMCDVRDGTHDSPKEHVSGYPLVTSKHIKNRRVDLGETYLISQSDFDQINKRSKVDQWDILFSMIGTVGEIALVNNNESFAIKNVGLIKTGNRRLGKYLFYYLWSPQAKRDLESLLSGSTQKFISLGRLRDFPVYLPSESEQARIVSILSTYDDLIENNEKRVKALEEMAQLLYTEWFVKFKFPGQEKVKMFDSGTEYGMIPEGWEVKTIQESFEILGGGTPSKTVSKYWGGRINWYTPTDLTGANQMFTDRSSENITESGLKKSSAKLFPPFCIMMTSRATIGVISINTIQSTTNQGFIVCIPNERVSLYYLYHWLKQHISLFIDIGSGATFKEISKSNFKKIKILLPDSEVIGQFEEKLKALGDLILRLQRKNQILTQTRDILIPQLVTGRRLLR